MEKDVIRQEQQENSLAPWVWACALLLLTVIYAGAQSPLADQAVLKNRKAGEPFENGTKARVNSVKITLKKGGTIGVDFTGTNPVVVSGGTDAQIDRYLALKAEIAENHEEVSKAQFVQRIGLALIGGAVATGILDAAVSAAAHILAWATPLFWARIFIVWLAGVGCLIAGQIMEANANSKISEAQAKVKQVKAQLQEAEILVE